MSIPINRYVQPPESQGCPSGLHQGSEKPTDGWHAVYSPGGNFDNPVNFALFGLARQTEEHFPEWVPMDMSLHVLDIGPGHKLVPGAERLDYPEFNFDDPRTVYSSKEHRERKIEELHRDFAKGRLEEKYITASGEVDERWLPYDDGSVGGIMAVNILEHLWEPRPFMGECGRVLAPGKPLNIFVPHGLSNMYIQDLDHKKPFNMDSFKNWLFNPFYWDRPDTFRIGAIFKFAIKDGNEGICAQLIKRDV